MKPLFYIIAFLIAGTVTAQKVNWITFNEALAAQKKETRPIIVDVYTDWCGPCKLMDKKTFQNDAVATFINKNYYAVKFNAEGTEEVNYLDNVYSNPYHVPNRRQNSQHEFAQAMRLTGYPSIAFFDTEGGFIQPLPGYRTPKDLEIYLKMIANGDYKELVTAEKWQAYQDQFEYTF